MKNGDPDESLGPKQKPRSRGRRNATGQRPPMLLFTALTFHWCFSRNQTSDSFQEHSNRSAGSILVKVYMITTSNNLFIWWKYGRAMKKALRSFEKGATVIITLKKGATVILTF